jgi:hypothetical protein
MPEIKLIGIGEAQVKEGSSTTMANLVAGMGIDPGLVEIIGVTTNEAYPMTATMISDDESQVVPGAGTVTGPVQGIYTWKFKWDELPELGCNAVLRFEELVPQQEVTDVGTDTRMPWGFGGATLSLTVNVLSDFDNACAIRLPADPDGDAAYG